jgi:hypothetical protein
LNAPLPCYRFAAWPQKPTDVANELRSYGAAFLAALEKRDAEEFQRLRQDHEIRMLELVRVVRRQQVVEAEASARFPADLDDRFQPWRTDLLPRCRGLQLAFPAQQDQEVAEVWAPFEEAIVIGWR